MNSAHDFESRRRELIDDITSAFGDVSREDGTTLHEAVALDDYVESADELRAARRLDVDGRWQDVPDADISACTSALSFMDEKGFRYYIPAFMTYGLRNWEHDENDSISAPMYHLLHESSKSLRKSEPASIAARYNFTGAQSKAVAKFLRFILDFGEYSGDEVTAVAVQKWEDFSNSLMARRVNEA